MTTGLERINIGISIALFVIFLYLLYTNNNIDKKNVMDLDMTVCHKEVILPKIRDIDRLVIESVFSEYWQKRSMNKSNCSKIWSDVKSGVISGALSGAIIGSGASSVIAGGLVGGVISGTMKAYGLVNGKSQYLLATKHT